MADDSIPDTLYHLSNARRLQLEIFSLSSGLDVFLLAHYSKSYKKDKSKAIQERQTSITKPPWAAEREVNMAEEIIIY